MTQLLHDPSYSLDAVAPHVRAESFTFHHGPPHSAHVNTLSLPCRDQTLAEGAERRPLTIAMTDALIAERQHIGSGVRIARS